MRINERITAPKMRVVGEGVTPGIYDRAQALAIARGLGLDLVEIVPDGNPPVCKVTDYAKYKYEKKKKEKRIKANSRKIKVKELRFTPKTHEHDVMLKCKHAKKFLEHGDKVKISVFFRRWEYNLQPQVQARLSNIIEELSPYGGVEKPPAMEGRRMVLFLNPALKKKESKKDKQVNTEENHA